MALCATIVTTVTDCETFTLATWNLQRPRARAWKKLPAIRQVLTKVDADIWILTESRTSVAPRPCDFHVDAPNDPLRHPDPHERWASVWSRWPCQDLGLRPTPWASAALVDSPLGQLIVYGAVLPYHAEPGPNGGRYPIWARFQEVLAEQASDWRTIHERYAETPLIVAGDLNQIIEGPFWYGSHVTRSALMDAFLRAGLTCITMGDAVPRERIRRNHLVDHVAISSHLYAESIDCWAAVNEQGVVMSDHPGVVVSIGQATD